MKAINLFNSWAQLGKDSGMELNHAKSVDYMISFIQSKFSKKFKFLDIGCGNGWVVRKISNYPFCDESVGIDGANEMIKKALLNDSKSSYFCCELNDLGAFDQKFDIVFSMEVLYYLKCPQTTLNIIYNSILKKDGCFIMGIDHYKENTPSLNWPQELNVPMCTYSELEWKNMFLNAGFSSVSISRVGKKDDWAGTLVLYGEK